MLKIKPQKKVLSYEESREYLDSLQFHKIKLGLQPMRDFHASLGNPEEHLNIVHVAGTNGKGSVCSALVSVVSGAGYKVGIYTSPHLSSARERFRINDDYISKADFARITSFIQERLAGRPITYFEFTTTLAFLWFYEQGVDLVVLETGLGGRLDATNIVSEPLVTVITSVSMDHEAYLGTTIGEVASEKAGIIKPGVPVVATSSDDRVVAVIKEFSEKKNAPLYLRGVDFTEDWQGGCVWNYSAINRLGGREYLALENAKPGAISAENCSAVVTTIELLRAQNFTISEQHIRTGLLNVRWPGRQEYLENIEGKEDCRYLLDGAHNPQGVQALVEALSLYSYSRILCVWGAMADKDIAQGLGAILPLCDKVFLTAVDSERTASPEAMVHMLEEEDVEKTRIFNSSEKALKYAETISQRGDLILVAGSLYLIGEIRPLLVGGLV